MHTHLAIKKLTDSQGYDAGTTRVVWGRLWEIKWMNYD